MAGSSTDVSGETLRRSAWIASAVGPPVLLCLLALAAWARPAAFEPLAPGIVPSLGIIMFGMGVGITMTELKEVLTRPRWLLLGVVLQFLLMPLLAWGISHGLALPLYLTAGMILTGSCPGGTASNVMVYLGGGNLALSVAMTTSSTLLAPLATPLLAQWYLGERIDLPVMQMYLSILQIVVLPVIGGMVVRVWVPHLGSLLERVMPGLAMVLIALIVATIVALNRDRLVQVGGLLLVAVVLHNLAGLVLGYLAGGLLGAGVSERRTVALEVGMQNSGLATALALKFMTPVAALPAAIFSIWHNISALLWVARIRHQEAREIVRPAEVAAGDEA